jgi:hypothetical protein
MTINYVTITDKAVFSAASFPVGGRFLTGRVGLHDTLSYKTKRGAGPVSALHLHDAFKPKWVYHPTLYGHVAFHDGLFPGHPVKLIQAMTFHAAIQPAYAVKLVQTLFLHGDASATAKYHKNLSDGVRLHPLIALFLGGFISETFDITSTVAPLWRRTGSIADGVVLEDDITPSLLVRFDLADELEIEDTTLLRAIFAGQLHELVNFAAAYVSPDGNFSTWAINTRTGAITEYDNYGFNSFGRIGNHFYGANAAGLWKLDGPTDNGFPVSWQFGGGLMAPGNVHFTAFKAAYLGMRVDSDRADFYLKLETGDGRVYNYQVQPNASMLTTKVRMGKGLRSRYFSWQLSGPLGEDFDLDSIEFIPLIAKRRV